MKATMYFGLAFGLLFNQIPFVYSVLTSRDAVGPIAGLNNSTVSSTTYIIEFASAASGSPANKRSLTVSVSTLSGSAFQPWPARSPELAPPGLL